MHIEIKLLSYSDFILYNIIMCYYYYYYHCDTHIDFYNGNEYSGV